MSESSSSMDTVEFGRRSKGLMGEFLDFVKTDKKLKAVAAGVFALAGGPAYGLLVSGRFNDLTGSLVGAGAVFAVVYSAVVLHDTYLAYKNRTHPDDLLDEKAFLSENEARLLFLRKQKHLQAFGENVLGNQNTAKVNQALIEKGLDSIKELAGHGEPKAQFFLARLHMTGMFVEQDFDKAKSLLEKSARQGQPDALFALSQLYLLGQGGVDKDSAKGLTLLEMACEKGSARALNEAGYVFQGGRHGAEADLGKAERCYERAKGLGHEEAGLRLADLQETIRFEQEQNNSIESRSLSVLKEKADLGDAQAHFELGSIYYFGVEADKDIEAGVAHLHSASQKGHPEAMSLLGQLHLYSRVNQGDADTGFALIVQAARLESASALSKLSEIEKNAQRKYGLWFELGAREALEGEIKDIQSLGKPLDIIALDQARENALPAQVSGGKTAFMSFYASRAFEAPAKSLFDEDAANIERAIGLSSYSPKM